MYLEGITVPVIMERVSRELARSGRIPGVDSLFFIESLLYGGEQLPAPSDQILGFVPGDLVAKGATILDEIDAESLFDDDELHRDQFIEWRELYIDAADHEEVLLIGYC